jgi:REP element-mobilizing transposase RayT
MPQSLANVLVHVIFSTKERRSFLQNVSIRQETSSYLAGILRNLECRPVVVGCVSDHVHILCSLSRNISLADLVEEVKKSSSKWVKTRGADFHDFQWQNGYGVFSVSPSNVNEVRAYIERQEDHHKATSFQEEFRRFLERHTVEYDERFVWD